MIRLAAIALCLAGCDCASSPRQACLTEQRGARVCVVADAGTCTWLTCDTESCLRQSQWPCEGVDVRLAGELPPVEGDMRRGCLWLFDDRRARFDPETCR